MAKQSLNLPYILVSGASIIAIVAIFATIRPQFSRWQATREEIGKVEATIATKQQFLLGIDRKKAELQGEALHEKQLAVVLPIEESLEDVTRILHKAGEASGAQVTRINNNGEGERARVRALRARGEATDIPINVEPISIEVQAAGNYQQLRVFIEYLERSPRTMDIISLKVNRNPTNVELLNLDMRVRLYEHEKGVADNG